MAMIVEGVPPRIHADDVRAVVDQVVNYVNERAYDDEVTSVDGVLRVKIAPEEVRVGRAFPRLIPGESSWGGAFVSDIGYQTTESVPTPTIIQWMESLGIVPSLCMEATIYGRYVQVVVFQQNDDGARVLRHDGEGFMKHTIDIPIYQENSRG